MAAVPRIAVPLTLLGIVFIWAALVTQGVITFVRPSSTGFYMRGRQLGRTDSRPLLTFETDARWFTGKLCNRGSVPAYLLLKQGRTGALDSPQVFEAGQCHVVRFPDEPVTVWYTWLDPVSRLRRYGHVVLPRRA